MPHSSCFVTRCRGRAATFVLISVLSVLQCATLSIRGVSHQIWNHVQNVEPNRHLQQLGEISETPGALTRTYLSNAHKQAAKQIQQWMDDAGMTAYIDVMGNVHGILQGTQPDLGELVVGSHYDTVVDGGKYDGALGVLLGISAVKTVLVQALHQSGRLKDFEAAIAEQTTAGGDVKLPPEAVKGLLRRSVHVIGFCDEEGIRFKSTFLGSRAMSGSLIKHKQLEVQDSFGTTLEDVLKSSGVEDPAQAIQALALDPAKVRHYVEFHIEQGPQLEAAGAALGVVSGIAGQTWLSVSMEGVQGHAGTVPMNLRQDPMAAAGEAIHTIESICSGNEEGLGGFDTIDQALVCTVGRLHTHPNQVNIIPRWVNFTVDIRCKHQDFRHLVISRMKDQIQDLCHRRRINCTILQTHDAAPVHCDTDLIAGLHAAILQAQPMIQQLVPTTPIQACNSSSSKQSSCASQPFSATQSEVPVLLSGAGHDSMAMADITKIAMVFVRCAGGISHNPAEYVDPRDVAAATAAFATFMEMDLIEQRGIDISDRVEL